jgi:two-component SAPR family response regulator
MRAMFNTIVVDDEQAALNRFERIISGDDRVALTGKFLYASDALAFSAGNPVDLAFLDIDMPEMSGLELAERLMELNPYLRVVFVTAYDKFALDAFRAHAVGYLLKPLDKSELAGQLDILSRRFGPEQEKPENNRLCVSCFGQFSVSCGSGAVAWKTAKAEELFALLVYYQGRVRSREALIDTLWPELEYEKAANLFRVTCTYLRNAFADRGITPVLLRELDGYKINTGLLDCDLFHFRLASRSLTSPERKQLEDAAACYRGAFLEGKPYEWALNTRTRLESDFKKLQHKLCDLYLDGGETNKAADAMEKLLRHDPCDEEAVLRLVNMKLQAGENAGAAQLYRGFEQTLLRELGTTPSPELRAALNRFTPG